jgi:adenylosuccinate synthase
MRSASVVIGSGFGCEGKGLVTDYLAADLGLEAVVVRFNGGAQARHTVVMPDGRRHAFSHFGSGSFAGSATYLSKFFVCNPLLFMKEKPRLSALGLAPVVYADEDCPITTPYDMMINQIAESARKEKRHGSCGLGFGETVERNHHPAYALAFRDLYDRAALKKKLLTIREDWSKFRLHALDIRTLADDWRTRFASDEILDCYLVNVEQFLDYVTPANIDILLRNRPVIFEGAQGLLLDQDKGFAPHVTRSHTGLKNVMTLARETGLDKLDVIYVTRPYAVRHGAGPLPHELEMPPYAKIEDETNLCNLYQGRLRFGWLDLDLLARSIVNDLLEKADGIDVQHRIAITCMDQVEDKVTFITDARLQSKTPADFLRHVLHTAHAEHGIASYGPSRNRVENFEAGGETEDPPRKEVMPKIA